MDTHNITSILKLIWPIIILEYGLLLYTVIDIAKKKKTKNLSPLVWILICVFVNMIGPILYLLFGRSDE